MSYSILDSYKIPDWLSSQVYYTAREYKACICNEKNWEYVVLDGLAAKFWDILINNSDSIEKFCIENECLDDLPSFCEELSNLELLIPLKQAKKNELASSQSLQLEEDISFEKEMKDWLVKNGYLPKLFIELTYNCNEKCIHCYNDKVDLVSYLSFDDLKQVIDESKKLGVHSIVLSGGECTLNKDFLKIVKYIRSQRIALEIFTNGQSLYDNPTLFEDLISLYPHRISLSVHSMKPEIHDKITGVKGSLEKTIAVIKKLKERNIRVDIKCFLMNLNADCYSDVVKFADELDITVTQDCKFFDNPKRCNSSVQVTEEQLLKIYTDKESKLFVKQPVHIDYKSKASLNRRLCGGAHSGLAISVDKNIYVCSSWKVPIGNILSDSIFEIWQNRIAGTKINELHEIRLKNLEECFKEDYCQYCTYCPGMTLANDKYLKKYEMFCKDAKIRMQAHRINMEEKRG